MRWLARRLMRWMQPKTLDELQTLFPEAGIEEVGDRREIVVYTGWSIATYDEEKDEWMETTGRFVPFPDSL